MRVGRVVIVHGTFMGDDPFGIAEMLHAVADGVPLLADAARGLAAELKRRTQALTAAATRDVANYTPAFRDRFQQLVGQDPSVELLQTGWSSQNHHFARAELAVRLIHSLLQRPLPENQRVLLWGHSHAGNAFALVTNLLANDATSVNAFFTAAGSVFDPAWRAVHDALRSVRGPHPLSRQVLVAGFGVPVRYGWDPTGCSGLVNVLFHRPFDAATPTLAKPMFPPHSPADTLNAAWGDWVQAFAIAGTDVPSPTSAAVHESMSNVLELGLAAPVHGLDTRFIMPQRLRDACARWKAGTRCHSDGRNLLVDYQPSGLNVPIPSPVPIPLETSVLGHGVATTVAWLPMHLKAVIEQLQLAVRVA